MLCLPQGAYHTPPVDPNAAGAAPGAGAPCQAPTPPGGAPVGQAEAAADDAAPGDMRCDLASLGATSIALHFSLACRAAVVTTTFAGHAYADTAASSNASGGSQHQPTLAVLAAAGNEYEGGDDYDDGGGMDWGPDDDCPAPDDASPGASPLHIDTRSTVCSSMHVVHRSSSFSGVVWPSTHMHVPPSTGRAAEQQRQQQEQQQPAAEQEEDQEEDVFDPWAPLDQHDDSGMARKPFRKAKRLPRFRPAPKAPPPSQPGVVPPAAPGLQH